jgi:hypothetical protein
MSVSFENNLTTALYKLLSILPNDGSTNIRFTDDIIVIIMSYIPIYTFKEKLNKSIKCSFTVNKPYFGLNPMYYVENGYLRTPTVNSKCLFLFGTIEHYRNTELACNFASFCAKCGNYKSLITHVQKKVKQFPETNKKYNKTSIRCCCYDWFDRRIKIGLEQEYYNSAYQYSIISGGSKLYDDNYYKNYRTNNNVLAVPTLDYEFYYYSD